jgi:transcriptional regulator with XRE-family HTH domain
MSGKPDEDKAFGAALGKYLGQYGKSRAGVASEMGITRSYISQLTTGAKVASAEKVDSLADTIGVSQEERVDLHRAAAKSAGFRIDLPEDF